MSLIWETGRQVHPWFLPLTSVWTQVKAKQLASSESAFPRAKKIIRQMGNRWICVWSDGRFPLRKTHPSDVLGTLKTDDSFSFPACLSFWLASLICCWMTSSSLGCPMTTPDRYLMLWNMVWSFSSTSKSKRLSLAMHPPSASSSVWPSVVRQEKSICLEIY